MITRKNLVLIFLPLILLFQGCVEIEYIVKINEDESQDVTIRLVLESAASSESNKIVSDIQDDGFEVTTYNREDDLIIEGFKQFTPEDQFIPIPGSKWEDTTSPLKTRDLLFAKEYIIDSRFKMGKKGAFDAYDILSLRPIPITYKISLPGNIKHSNSNDRKNGYAIWNNQLKSGEQVHIKIHSYDVYWERVAVLIFLLFITIFLIRKK